MTKPSQRMRAAINILSAIPVSAALIGSMALVGAIYKPILDFGTVTHWIITLWMALMIRSSLNTINTLKEFTSHD